MNEFDSKNEELPKYYGIEDYISNIFIIYDVDSAKYLDIIKKYNKYNDSDESGLLVLSNPCIEALADQKHIAHIGTPDKYKEYIAKTLNIDKNNLCEYIQNNLIELLIFQIKYNIEKTGSYCIYDHLRYNYRNLEANIIDKVKNINTYPYIFAMFYHIISDVFNYTYTKEGIKLLLIKLDSLK